MEVAEDLRSEPTCYMLSMLCVMPRLPNTSPQTLSVLELLLESPRSWRNGYALSQPTGLKSGTLYPILLRLADQGWLEDSHGAEKPRNSPAVRRVIPIALTQRGREDGASEELLAEAAPVKMSSPPRASAGRTLMQDMPFPRPSRRYLGTTPAQLAA